MIPKKPPSWMINLCGSVKYVGVTFGMDTWSSENIADNDTWFTDGLNFLVADFDEE